MTATMTATMPAAASAAERANEMLRKRLQESLAIEGKVTVADLVVAQNDYELAKANEIQAAIEYDDVKYAEAYEWELAYAGAVGSSQAAKKESAERSETWLAYEKRKRRATDTKRQAEVWHSIAYQRLETIREVYKKS